MKTLRVFANFESMVPSKIRLKLKADIPFRSHDNMATIALRQSYFALPALF